MRSVLVILSPTHAKDRVCETSKKGAATAQYHSFAHFFQNFFFIYLFRDAVVRRCLLLYLLLFIILSFSIRSSFTVEASYSRQEWLLSCIVWVRATQKCSLIHPNQTLPIIFKQFLRAFKWFLNANTDSRLLMHKRVEWKFMCAHYPQQCLSCIWGVRTTCSCVCVCMSIWNTFSGLLRARAMVPMA